MSSPVFPEPPAPVSPTPDDRVDAALERLANRKRDWCKLGVTGRVALLRACLRGVQESAAGWARDGSLRKGIAPGSALEGEEWIVGPMITARNVRLLADALEAGGAPRPRAIDERPGGQLVAHITPADAHERVVLGGARAEVWIERGKPATQGKLYREGQSEGSEGRVALVLGAGNVSSIPPTDALYKLFVENEVVLLKMNPVNADAGPHIERAFRPLIDAGYLAIVYGGGDLGARLAEHPLIDTLHVTGSDKTYDAIKWGTDAAERLRRKSSGEPKNARPFTAELGCVTPVLVVPGVWSERELEFQAQHVAGMVAQNASFNCNAAKVVVTADGWPQRRVFLRKLEEALAATPPRKAYYPGARERYHAFLEHYPAAKPLGVSAEGVVPWTLLPDVAPTPDQYALRNEAFCGVIADVALEAAGPAEFLEKAVAFANGVLWGTLSACLLIDTATARACGGELDRAIETLRYGGLGVNCWPGLIYGLVSPTWGAFPGHVPRDIQSGVGVVHNTMLFDYPERSVVYAPFVARPKPTWFPQHKTLRILGERLTAMEVEPSWAKLAGVVAAALGG